jgi:hypothetical protein
MPAHSRIQADLTERLAVDLQVSHALVRPGMLQDGVLRSDAGM